MFAAGALIAQYATAFMIHYIHLETYVNTYVYFKQINPCGAVFFVIKPHVAVHTVADSKRCVTIFSRIPATDTELSEKIGAYCLLAADIWVVSVQ